MKVNESIPVSTPPGATQLVQNIKALRLQVGIMRPSIQMFFKYNIQKFYHGEEVNESPPMINCMCCPTKCNLLQ